MFNFFYDFRPFRKSKKNLTKTQFRENYKARMSHHFYSFNFFFNRPLNQLCESFFYSLLSQVMAWAINHINNKYKSMWTLLMNEWWRQLSSLVSNHQWTGVCCIVEELLMLFINNERRKRCTFAFDKKKSL